MNDEKTKDKLVAGRREGKRRIVPGGEGVQSRCPSGPIGRASDYEPMTNEPVAEDALRFGDPDAR